MARWCGRLLEIALVLEGRPRALLAWCTLALAFLLLPIFVSVPMSVNSEAFFAAPLKGVSWRWYRDALGSGEWRDAIRHSIVIAIGIALPATSLGTLGAVLDCRVPVCLRGTASCVRFMDIVSTGPADAMDKWPAFA
jgi:ABC-type spermidine/putrescine transport system permease subunit II